MSESGHTAVMRDAVIAALAVRPEGRYVDATYGRGGHSAALLEHLGPGGRLLALDRDPDACADAWQRWGREPRFRIEHRSFDALAEVLAQEGWLGGVDGILMDLGVSSPQLDDAGRGFSFRYGGPLDMRMDPSSGISAAEWLADAPQSEIARVLRDYGEERFAGRIARAIVAERDVAPIDTTDRLAEIVRAVVPQRVAATGRIDPATRTFQAIRIHVNGELEALRAGLDQSLEALAPGGRLAVISFHSLEDRIVKRFIRAQARPEPPPVPMAPAPAPTLREVGRPQRADAAEVEANPRARSAMLRVAERLEAT